MPRPVILGVVGDSAAGKTTITRGLVRIPADVDPEEAGAIEEAVWQKMHFASHLRTERLGEFTIGTELRRSETLALVQLLILYHLVTARAAVALGGEGARTIKTRRSGPVYPTGQVETIQVGGDASAGAI